MMRARWAGTRIQLSGRRGTRRDRRGVTLVIVAIMFTVLMGFAAMALDFGRMYDFKADLKTLADAAAHSAMLQLKAGSTQAVAYNNVTTLVANNKVEGSRTGAIASADLVPVTWDSATKIMTPASWADANGVRVVARYTANWTLARVFGVTTKVLSETSVAAYTKSTGSAFRSSCLKPFAVPYAALLSAMGKPSPYNMSYVLTASDLTTLQANRTEVQFLDNGGSSGSTPGNFGWVDVNVSGGGNGNQQIADALSGCVSTGLGVGSSLSGIPGNRSASVIRTALDNLCGSSTTCTNITPILVPIYNVSGGSGASTTFTVNYIGAFRLTRQDSNGLWGYLTIKPATATETTNSTVGPVGGGASGTGRIVQ